MTLSAGDIVDDVSEQLNDLDHTTWSEDVLLGYITSAEREIITIRPDAYSIVTTMQLVAGAKQSLSSDYLRLLDIKRNMGANGTTPGRSIQAVEDDALDLFDFNWSAESGSAVTKNYSYDEKTPNVFYVDPPSDGTNYIEMSVSRAPPVIDSVNDDLVLADTYYNAVVQWCMFRAYSIEVDSASSQRRAAAHEASFNALMGRKFSRDATFSPSPEVNPPQGSQ